MLPSSQDTPPIPAGGQAREVYDSLQKLVSQTSYFLPKNLASVSQGLGVGIGVSTPIEAGDVEDGDIISFRSGKYYLSTEDYDSHMLGVVSIDPAISISETSESGLQGVSLISSGRS